MTAVAPNTPDILSAEHDRDPEIAYRYLREHAPAVFQPGSNSWLIGRHEGILRLVRGKHVDSKNYEAGIGVVYGRNLLEMDGREHQQQRTLLNPLLHGVNLEAYQPLIRKVADELSCPLTRKPLRPCSVASGPSARWTASASPSSRRDQRDDPGTARRGGAGNHAPSGR
jgi:cytochrome P450